MKIDGAITDLAHAASEARTLESIGYDGAFTSETIHDPFLPLVLAAEHTKHLEVGTAIAVAFPRSPMHLANLGYDLQQYSQGRAIVGLGSQVKAHVEKRFSATWSHPAARMREVVLAMRAIWAAWNDATKLEFRGEMYRHTLMTPFFDPGPNEFGNAKIFLAAVGEMMAEVAGEVADGLIVHGFTTERYVREVTIPALERGLDRAGRTRSEVEITGPLFVVTGNTAEEMDAASAGVRKQISFYGSTPAYRKVLELHGWGELGDELHKLSRQGEWDTMAGLIDDEVLGTFAVVAEPEQVPAKMIERYGGLVDRLSFYAPYDSDPERWAEIVAGFKK